MAEGSLVCHDSLQEMGGRACAGLLPIQTQEELEFKHWKSELKLGMLGG